VGNEKVERRPKKRSDDRKIEQEPNSALGLEELTETGKTRNSAAEQT
jgi:hypothetical protein